MVYKVSYNSYMLVRADSEEEALEKAMDEEFMQETIDFNNATVEVIDYDYTI